MSEGESPKKQRPTPDSKGEEKKPGTDAFIIEQVFPEAAAVFASRVGLLRDAKDSAIIVVDTNALLVPYGIGSQTLSQISATYARLLAENRLIIPAQVAREFARNRSAKLSDLFQKLSKQRDARKKFDEGAHPMLEGLDEYKRLRQAEKQLDTLLAEYGTAIAALIARVGSWEWNDPVSTLYSSLFSADVVVDTKRSRDDVHKEHLHRLLHKIPPGYKDSAKDDGGIGDLLVWLTILNHRA